MKSFHPNSLILYPVIKNNCQYKTQHFWIKNQYYLLIEKLLFCYWSWLYYRHLIDVFNQLFILFWNVSLRYISESNMDIWFIRIFTFSPWCHVANSEKLKKTSWSFVYSAFLQMVDKCFMMTTQFQGNVYAS